MPALRGIKKFVQRLSLWKCIHGFWYQSCVAVNQSSWDSSPYVWQLMTIVLPSVCVSPHSRSYDGLQERRVKAGGQKGADGKGQFAAEVGRCGPYEDGCPIPCGVCHDHAIKEELPAKHLSSSGFQQLFHISWLLQNTLYCRRLLIYSSLKQHCSFPLILNRLSQNSTPCYSMFFPIQWWVLSWIFDHDKFKS